ERDVELVADGHDLLHVLAKLVVGLVQRRVRLAGQLDLAAGLERDLAAPAGERDDAALLLLWLPAVAVGEPAQDGLHAARTRERDGGTRATVDRGLLVLGADAEPVARLRPPLEVLE